MRLIDADVLRNKLENLADDEWNRSTTTSWAEAFSECADMVDEQPTIEPEPPWIPCKVRLPDHNADVLVTDADETEMGRRSHGRWLDCYGDKMKDVTAWMPKPKPYREGE